jgi:hypothetical protein
MHACPIAAKKVVVAGGFHYNIQTSNLLLQHLNKNICNIRLKQMKYLGHIVETPLQHVQHPDLLLKYLNATLTTYKRRQMKHLRHASETLERYMYKK